MNYRHLDKDGIKACAAMTNLPDYLKNGVNVVIL